MYSTPQNGGELPYFVGKQYGSGWLRTLGRLAFPIIKRLGRMALGTASDVLVKSQPLLPSLKDRAIKSASKLLPEVVTNIGNHYWTKEKNENKEIYKQTYERKRNNFRKMSCAKTELCIFDSALPQVVVDSTNFEEIYPINALEGSSDIQFNIIGSNTDYLDLNDTLLSVTVKVTG